MGDRFAPPAFGRKAVKADGGAYPLPATMQQNASFNALARYVSGDGSAAMNQGRPARATTSYPAGACQSFSSLCGLYVLDFTAPYRMS